MCWCGRARVSQINVVCLLSRLHSNTQLHTHLSWASPHLCWSSDITKEPTSICWRRRTPPRTSLCSHVLPDCALLLWLSLSSWSQILAPHLSLLWEGSFQKTKIRTCQIASARWGLMTSWTAAAAMCASLWRVILAIWQKQRGGCEECKRDGWSGCHSKPALFHRSGPWLAAAAAEGRKFCQLETIDVLLPGQADLSKNLTFIGNKIAPRVWKGENGPKINTVNI